MAPSLGAASLATPIHGAPKASQILRYVSESKPSNAVTPHCSIVLIVLKVSELSFAVSQHCFVSFWRQISKSHKT